MAKKRKRFKKRQVFTHYLFKKNKKLNTFYETYTKDASKSFSKSIRKYIENKYRNSNLPPSDLERIVIGDTKIRFETATGKYSRFAKIRSKKVKVETTRMEAYETKAGIAVRKVREYKYETHSVYYDRKTGKVLSAVKWKRVWEKAKRENIIANVQRIKGYGRKRAIDYMNNQVKKHGWDYVFDKFHKYSPKEGK